MKWLLFSFTILHLASCSTSKIANDVTQKELADNSKNLTREIASNLDNKILKDPNEIISEYFTALGQKTLNDPKTFYKILGTSYFASSSWLKEPFLGFMDSDRDKLIKEAEFAYERLKNTTPSLKILSESFEFEEGSLCTKLEVVKTKETSIESNYRESYYFSQNIVANFVNKLVDLTTQTLALSSYSNTSGSFSSSYKYYQVERDVKCTETKRMLRAVVKLTPDLMNLAPQLFAKLIITKQVKEREQLLTFLEDTAEKLKKYSEACDTGYCRDNSIDHLDIALREGDIFLNTKINRYSSEDDILYEPAVKNWFGLIQENVLNYAQFYKVDEELSDEVSNIIEFLRVISKDPKLTKRYKYDIQLPLKRLIKEIDKAMKQ